MIVLYIYYYNAQIFIYLEVQLTIQKIKKISNLN